MDEQVIAKGIREGSREALGMLWREHSTKMLNLAFRMLKDRDRAEDILMDVFVGIPDAIRAFRGQSALGTWLYRLTVNACLMKLRAEKRHGELEELNLDTIVEETLGKQEAPRNDQFDPATLAARELPWLYACGEALDVDADCGGYNLGWAWKSGMVAGEAAARWALS
jgi:RNA polymerase sigma-70 factor (ECF subfamily)